MALLSTTGVWLGAALTLANVVVGALVMLVVFHRLRNEPR